MQGEFIFEGKKYISASRASKIIGYTSDYIGQLCRKGSLDCRMVGRSWFVEEESLKNHKVIASSTPRGRISIYQKEATQSVSASGLATRGNSKKAFEKSELAFLSAQQEWKDYLNQDTDRKQVFQFSTKIAGAVFALIFLFTASSVFLSNKNQFVTNPIFTIRSSEKIIVIEKSVEELATIFTASQREARGSIAYSANVFQSVNASVRETLAGMKRGMYRGIAWVNNFLFDATKKVRVLVMNTKNETDGVNGGRDRTGVAVVPASPDDSVNEKVKQYVTDSFSDEAYIIPDESGNSGVIKPVFKENSDQEYLYVIVPVKENTN